jgi:hypothetical protein
MPSVAMIPYFEEFASDYPDFLFLSVDVDEVKVMFSGLLFFLTSPYFNELALFITTYVSTFWLS